MSATSLYVHLPWCLKKCPYCDFNSHKSQDAPFAAYVDALLVDLDDQLDTLGAFAPVSIFLGGGTPSLVPLDEIARLMQGLHARLDTQGIEITLEANPGALERADFSDYLALGINRLSLGVQSLDTQALITLGRMHCPSDALDAIYEARASGFKRVNVDLMHGLPAQTVDRALYDLKGVIDAGATHLSWYQLTIEKGTAFYKAPPDLPSEAILEAIETIGGAYLADAGFTRYEVSAYVSSFDMPARHNMHYWHFGDYLALGAGAHGKLYLDVNQAQALFDTHLPAGFIRYHKTRVPKDYLRSHKAHADAIPADHLAFEYALNVLRLTEGVHYGHFREVTGMDDRDFLHTCQDLIERGLLCRNRFCATAQGALYLNQLMGAFLP